MHQYHQGTMPDSVPSIYLEVFTIDHTENVHH